MKLLLTLERVQGAILKLTLLSRYFVVMICVFNQLNQLNQVHSSTEKTDV